MISSAKNLWLSCMVLLMLAMPAAAHEGHGLGAVVVDVIARNAQAGETRLELAITNYGAQPVVMMGIGLAGQGSVLLPRPLPVSPGGGTGQATVTLPLAVPGAFTVIVDFGPDGPLPVLVPAP